MKKILYVIFALILLPTDSVRALSPADYIGQGIYHYSPSGTSTSGAVSCSLSGDTNEARIFSFFVGQGYNSAAAAGILGNIASESAHSFSPFRMQDTYNDINDVLPIDQHSEKNRAFGLVQWDLGRRQQILRVISEKFPDYTTDINTYNKDYKSAPPDLNMSYLETELTYIMKELTNSYKGVDDFIKTVPNTVDGAKSAADKWVRQYEVPADVDKTSLVRQGYAEEYFNQFSGSTETSAPTCGQPAGNTVLYDQGDPKWAQHSFANSHISLAGCGPTAMAMILATLYDSKITPADVADAYDQNATSGEMDGQTHYDAMIRAVKAKWGIDVNRVNSLSDAVDFVKSGKGFVWMTGGNTGYSGAHPFSPQGHLVALVGITDDGKLTIANPAHNLNDNGTNLDSYSMDVIQAGSKGWYTVAKP